MFSSKARHVQADSAVIKHLESKHQGKSEDKPLSDYLNVEILKHIENGSPGVLRREPSLPVMKERF